MTLRVELIHPMLVHFPIALLLVGTGIRCAAFFAREHSGYPALLFTSRLVLAIGLGFAVLTILAGELAESVVGKTLCLPEVLEDHAALAFTATFLYAFGLLGDFVGDPARDWIRSGKFKKFVVTVSYFLLLAGALLLLLAARLGGSLVYDQGAATERVCASSK